MVFICILNFNFDMAFVVSYLDLLPDMVFYIGARIGIGIYLIIVIIYAGPKKLSKKSDSEMLFFKCKFEYFIKKKLFVYKKIFSSKDIK
ncbi:MAG: hypothetical protein EAX96_15180 [Candidatus Lokiarchaeota archaeon]|nr:hypothetical protein [Candidatus Lokiarchaeota archaeon]